MKKLVYPVLSFTIIFLASCGENDIKKENTSVAEETPLIQEEVVAEEETTEEVDNSTTTEYDIEAGKELYTSNGCVACHQLDAKTVGPSVKEVASAYTDNREGLTAFLKGEAKPIVDPTQEAVMKPQLEITKKLPEADLQNMIAYILSNK